MKVFSLQAPIYRGAWLSSRLTAQTSQLAAVRRDALERWRRARSRGLSAEEAAARQASAEVAEAQRLQRAEHANVVETLSGMFPDLDREIISDVVYQKEGRSVSPYPSPRDPVRFRHEWASKLTRRRRVGLAVDACLALST